MVGKLKKTPNAMINEEKKPTFTPVTRNEDLDKSNFLLFTAAQTLAYFAEMVNLHGTSASRLIETGAEITCDYIYTISQKLLEESRG